MMYLKILYEYHKQRILDMINAKKDSKPLHGAKLASFQTDAVVSAVRIIREYGGVIIADSTGLGKTHIAIGLLRKLAGLEGKKILLLAPAQIIRSMWTSKLDQETSMNIKTLSIENTGSGKFDPTDYHKYDAVLIDESQNFRTYNTARRIAVMKLLQSGKPKNVILMTATPINNRLLDVYHQLSLITAGDDSHFASMGIYDIYKHIRSADREKNFEDGVTQMVPLLDEIMVRRTRNVIANNYPDEKIAGKKLKFPKSTLSPVHYDVADSYKQVYQDIVNVMEKVALVPYRVDYYKRDKTDKEKENIDVIARLQKILLLKRFESSHRAVELSVSNLYRLYDYFAKSMNEGKFITSKALRKILTKYGTEISNEKFVNAIIENKELVEFDSVQYDTNSMQQDLKEDMKIISRLHKKLNDIGGIEIDTFDPKLEKLFETIDKEKALESESKKVIIFTGFTDTAKHIYKHICKRYSNYNIVLMSGDTHMGTREKYLKLFSPRSNIIIEDEEDEKQVIQDKIESIWKTIDDRFIHAHNKTKQIDILVSTDVLSEGQNIQDCNYVVNFDLPWNPMRIVQRVGRVDRLNTEHDTVHSVVFFPNIELNDLLHLTEKLQTKIGKAGATGTENSLLGEQATPRSFNVLVHRISQGDKTVMNDIARMADILPENDTMGVLMRFIKEKGSEFLNDISFGRRSGKKTDGPTSLIMVYGQSKHNKIHVITYDYAKARYENVNNYTKLFADIQCDFDEETVLPLSDEEAIRQINIIDLSARDYIVDHLNDTLSKHGAIKRKRYQEKLLGIINDGSEQGLVRMDDDVFTRAYDILAKRNLEGYEEDFENMIDTYVETQDMDELSKDLKKFVRVNRIQELERIQKKDVLAEELTFIGCEFLVGKHPFDLRIQ
ncbi:MAG: helicase [Cenarchaeum symbiont of Oopsacas minuta]|nr:helicase [Cenarchaeum symbiont of Oopsacas minuta]